MTTIVKIEAHCSSDKEVLIEVMREPTESYETDDVLLEQFKLEDGEKAERYVYDARYVTVREQLKEKK